MWCRFHFVVGEPLDEVSPRGEYPRMPLPLALILVLLALVACQRSPEEPPSAASVTVPSATSPRPRAPAVTDVAASAAAPSTAASLSASPPASPPAAPARCIFPTPKTAPPAVSAASLARCPADPEGGPPKLTEVGLSFPDARGASLQVELVRSEKESARGLMYRRTMPADRGMLFRMNERREQTFWMRNTCLSLDMVFIDDDGFIVGILENVPTLNDDERTVGCPSSWVLETNAGWTRRHGVVAGQRVEIPTAARVAASPSGPGGH